MPTIFYEIFNNIIKLDSKTIKSFERELEKLFEELKLRNDIDNLKVLRNRLSHLLDNKKKKIAKKDKKSFKKLEAILEELNEAIDSSQTAEEAKTKVIDIVKKIEKKYRDCSKIPEEKREKYKCVCAKKSTISYEKELIQLQVELLKLQKHIKENNEKLIFFKF